MRRPGVRNGPPRRWGTLTLVMVAGAVLSGCTGSGGGSAAGLGPAWKGYSQAQATYGLAMGTAEGIRYQPDVVLVGGGPDSILSASADRQTWTIKGGADHAQDLKVGSVMVLTTLAVGRVTALGHSGGNLVVTLAPVELTDVFHDATFHLHQAIDPVNLAVRQIALPDGGESPVSLGGATASATPAPSPPSTSSSSPAAAGLPSAGLGAPQLVRFVAPAAGGTGGTLPPPAPGNRFQNASADWDNLITADRGGISLDARRKLGGGRLFNLELELRMSQPALSLDLVIAGGQVQSAKVLLDGISGLLIDFFGGSAEGVSTNIHDKVVVPMMNCLGLPSASGSGAWLQVCETVDFIVDTAFSAKMATLTGRGEYDFGGSQIGFSYEAGKQPTLIQPYFHVDKPMTESLVGPSIGVNAVVFGAKERFSFGVGGTYNNLDGPYLDLIQTVGATKGSQLALVPCNRVDFGLRMRGGWDSPPSGVTNSVVNTGVTSFSTGIVKIIGGTRYAPPLKACAP